MKTFQRQRGLNPSGNVGPSTWDRLIVTLRRGDSGSAVRAVQHNFRFAYGFRVLPVTGFFGARPRPRSGPSSAAPGCPSLRGHSPTWMTIIRFES